jgi:predicted HTH domain antitoxin
MINLDYILQEVLMQQAAITFSDDLLLSLNMSVNEIVSSMRKEYAAKMYQEGKLTLGQAAEFCGVCLYDFTALLAVQDIPVINYDPEDLDRELESIGVL